MAIEITYESVHYEMGAIGNRERLTAKLRQSKRPAPSKKVADAEKTVFARS